MTWVKPGLETTPVCFSILLFVFCFTLFCFLIQLLFNIYTERLQAQMSYFLCHKDAMQDMQETRVQLWGQEKQPAPVFLLGKFHRGACQATVHAIAKNQTRLSD